MNILKLEEIERRLSDKRLYRVAEKTGLSYPTVLALSRGEKRNYTLKTLMKITEYLKK